MVTIKHLLTCTLLLLVMASGACSLPVDNCGPFENRFKTVDFASAAYRLGDRDSLTDEPSLSALQEDTLSPGEFGIRMVAEQELYFSATSPAKTISFVSDAHACSPPIPSSVEVIEAIEIHSDSAFNVSYPAGKDLSDLFDVMVLDKAAGINYERIPLPQFLEGGPRAVDAMILVLRSHPSETGGFRFTVTYRQDGPGIGEYVFTTEEVVLGPD